MDLLEQGKVVGQLQVKQEGLYTLFQASTPTLGADLQAVYLIGEQGQQRLGVLEKIGVGGDLRRRLSRQMLRPLGTITHGDVRPVGDSPWQPLPHHAFQSPYLQVQCAKVAGGLWRSQGSGGQIAVPMRVDAPFALMSYFCFFKDRQINKAPYLVVTLDNGEHPMV